MVIFLGILGYLLASAAFCAWDAFIGMPVKWDPENRRTIPCWAASLMWPIVIPIVCLIGFSKFLNGARERREHREEKIERLRIVAERAKEKELLEEEKLMEQIEAEIENETKATHSS